VRAQTGDRPEVAVLPQPDSLVEGASLRLDRLKESPSFGRDLNQSLLLLPAGLAVDASHLDPTDYRGLTIVFLNQLLGTVIQGLQLEILMRAARATALSA
jgi:hypothetical protein